MLGSLGRLFKKLQPVLSAAGDQNSPMHTLGHNLSGLFGGATPDSPDIYSIGEQGGKVPVYTGQGTGSAPQVPAEPSPPTGSDAIMQQIRDAEDVPGKRNASFLGRLFHGASTGLANYGRYRMAGGESNPALALGALAGGGGTAAFKPSYEAGLTKSEGLQKLFGRYQEQAAMEAAQLAQIKTAAEAQKALGAAHNEGIEGQQKELNYRLAQAKQYIEDTGAKGERTPEEIQHIRETWGVDVANPNNPKLVEATSNGQKFIRRSGDPRYTVNPTLPVDQGEMSVPTTINTAGGSTTIPLRPGQAASTIVGIEQANAQRSQHAADRAEAKANSDRSYDQQNYQFEQGREDKQTETANQQQQLQGSWQQRQAKARAEYNAGVAEHNRLVNARASGDTYVTDADIAKQEAKIAAAEQLLSEPPPAPKVKPRSLRKGGKYSTADIERVIRQ